MADVSFSFHGARFQPLPCGALFWPDESALLAADLHLEKGSSLARAGWLLPPYDSVETLTRLLAAIRQTGAERLFLLGDSFHDRGGVHRLTEVARQRLAAIAALARIVWITGNHDGTAPAALPGTVADVVTLSGIALVHHPADAASTPCIAGHFHPKVVVPLRHGRAARRRCIAAGPRAMILPAYGAYAGGLDIGDPAFIAACGGPPAAIVATPGGIVTLKPAAERQVA